MTGARAMHTTPASLLQRLRHPEERQAWARFVDLYTPVLYTWACRLGMQESDAADLVQDVLVLLLKKLPEFTYDEHKSFRAWLRTVTLNKWRNKLRRSVPVGGAGGSLSDVADPAAEESFWDQEYSQRVVARALEVMKVDFQPTTWKAFWECVAMDRPAADVAAELGLSVGAVYVAKCRLLTRLRQELEGLLD